jgi:hypothetical protein
MSDAAGSEPTRSPTPDDVLSLAGENAASALELRTSVIPQHVGMAVACRALAAELPRAIVAGVEADLASGALATRWQAGCDAAVADGVDSAAAPLHALAVLLREQSRVAMRHLVSRAKDWTSEAYRLEGQATVLVAQAERLRHLGEPSPAAAIAEPVHADVVTGG